MTISGKQKRFLRGLSHEREPVVIIGGKGLREAVVSEIEQALGRHELLKIKLPALPKQQRDQMLSAICTGTGSELVQTIGRVGVIYRRADPPGIQLPD